jgi:hypothetical protein
MKSSLSPAQDLRRRALTWAVKLKVNPGVVRVQEMHRKWGSCSSKGTIILAMDLLDQDSAFQDYVMVHELLHLRYPNHGKMFRALLHTHVPEWQQCEILAKAKPCSLGAADMTSERSSGTIITGMLLTELGSDRNQGN